MREHRITTLELVALGATRGLIGLGAGLLIADRISRRRRRPTAGALLAGGALSTIPIMLLVLRRTRRAARRAREAERPGVYRRGPEDTAAGAMVAD
ncbi:MAG: hypothetical protein KF773_03595 [Deltaproteobacteria bacterium]|nr:hypothetical protein [Deltaproteobacteria bacterium]